MPTSAHDANQPQLVTKVVAGERVLGYVVIDSLVRGRAHGGLRILDRIATIGYRVWERRVVVSKGDIVRLSVGCLIRALKRTCRRRGRGEK